MLIINKENVIYKLCDLTSNKNTELWLCNNFKTWEKDTFSVFRHYANKEKIVIDIGAWIGLTGIWLAKNNKSVICVEGDKEAVKSLRKNLDSSECDNYIILDKPIYSSNTDIIFGANCYRKDLVTTLNDSMSQIKKEITSSEDYKISAITLADILKIVNINEIGLIKVDIEGGEENILLDLCKVCIENKIPILISFHVDWWINKDIKRFEDSFKRLKIYNVNFTEELNPIDCIQKEPFISLILESK